MNRSLAFEILDNKIINHYWGDLTQKFYYVEDYDVFVKLAYEGKFDDSGYFYDVFTIREDGIDTHWKIDGYCSSWSWEEGENGTSRDYHFGSEHNLEQVKPTEKKVTEFEPL